ncbi:MAG: tetraacyldisaccharide 4'-kinase, partial [Rhodospirillales bacterium]|nr:tetraacyldisaccharide 4'-kinase [Rhodospirillales bacterium]
DRHGALAALPPGLPVLRAAIAARGDAAAWRGRRVLAFAGIGRPEKFFATLAELGAVLVAKRAFPDHAPYAPATLAALRAEAARLDAVAATTEKDAARIAPAQLAGIAVLGVELRWEDATALTALLARFAARGAGR